MIPEPQANVLTAIGIALNPRSKSLIGFVQPLKKQVHSLVSIRDQTVCAVKAWFLFNLAVSGLTGPIPTESDNSWSQTEQQTLHIHFGPFNSKQEQWKALNLTTVGCNA